MTVADVVKHRSLLFAIAYWMLGSASEAEDKVQETSLRMQAAKEEWRGPEGVSQYDRGASAWSA